MSVTYRRRLLVLLGLAVLLMTILAFGLPTLQFRSGDALPLRSPDQTPAAGGSLGDAPWLIMILRGILALGIILLPVYILISMLTPEGRRRLLAEIILVVVLLLVASWLAERQRPPGETEQDLEAQLSMPELPEGEAGVQAAPVFEPQTQPWMLTATVLGVAGLVAVIAYFLLRNYLRRRSVVRTSYTEMADHAQEALTAIEAGVEFSDVVIRYYAQMSQALQTERGIKRPQAMTPFEFEQELLARGFPARPVHLLTQLFEQVRYGRQKVSERDQRAASESLIEILMFCRGQYGAA